MKAIKILFTVIILLSLEAAQFLSAQTTGTLTGTVYNGSDGLPMPGVNLEIQGTAIGGVTNIQGQYTMINIPPGTYQVAVTGSISLPGAIRTVTINAGETTVQDFWIGDPTIPIISLTGTTVSNITSSTAESGGNIITDGGSPVTSRGVCWSTVTGPTTSDNVTDDGTGTGVFTSNLTNLTPGTIYYVRAYATNSIGTAYGTEVSFTTTDCPTVTVAISGTTEVCQGSPSPNVTFTGTSGTPPFRIYFTINGTPDLIFVDTPETSNEVDIPVPTSTAGTYIYSLISAYDASGVSCSQAQSGSATVTVNPLPTATISGTTEVCQNSASPLIIFTGADGTAPYTFTYKINDGADQTITTTSGNTVPLPVPTGSPGTFEYTLVSVSDNSSTHCSQAQSGSAIVTVNPLPTASISGTTNVCQNEASPEITFTGANGTAPYTFTYKINNGGDQTVTTTVGNSVQVPVPTDSPGTIEYTLQGVSDNSSTLCSQAQSGSATITVNPLPTATISGTTEVCQNSASPLIIFTGADGTAPYTFTYKVNNGGDQTVTTTSGNSVPLPVPTNSSGTYEYMLVSVSDNSSTHCSQAQSGSATVTVNPLPELSADVTQINCAGGNVILGSIDLTVTGSGGYTYDWTVDPGEYDFSGEDPVSLEPGVYQVTVTDANTCSNTLSAEVLNPLIVTNTDDDSFGSLRWAIIYANDHTNVDTEPDEISFDIPGEGPHTIQPGSLLPAITDPLSIDGYTQPGASYNTNSPGQGLNTVLKIEIDGSNAGSPATGFFIYGSGNSIIRGLAINRFSNRGIAIWGAAGSNTIEGNFIGTDINGSNDTNFGNGVWGIEIDASDNNIIKGNIISGNGWDDPNPGANPGVIIHNGSDVNQIIGNFIGTDRSGVTTLPNRDIAINIEESPGNIIGGSNPEDRNIILGGISLAGQVTIGSKISGNYFGVDVSGNSALGQAGGISLWSQASENEIGPGNVISGIQNGNPVYLGEGTFDNRVFGNIIGLGADGDTLVTNLTTGIFIENSSYNRVGGLGPDSINIISASENDYGIFVGGQNSFSNSIVGNYIGTNSEGNEARGNAREGIVITGGASTNTIQSNLISGNGFFGIGISGSATTGNEVIDNLIGVNAANNALISNGDDGINIGQSSDNIITGNVICGAGIGFGVGNNGIEILGSTASGNIISGNYIGTNNTNTTGLGNGFNGVQIKRDAHHNTIGPENVISGNWAHGILVESESLSGYGNTADNNIIYGNLIGIASDGETALGNNGCGILIFDNASENTIGPDNVISSNAQDGIRIETTGSTENKVFGNFIGTSADGNTTLGNSGSGINLCQHADLNIVGGVTVESRNIISGNSGDGILIDDIEGTIISGNYIGTNSGGTLELGNQGDGINLQNGTILTKIGGKTPSERNIISGNKTGIRIEGKLTTDNIITGNYIGLAANGNDWLGNTNGGIFIQESAGNYIGGIEPGEGNVISGNGQPAPAFPNHGIQIFNVVNNGPNYIQGNYIGTDATGMYSRGNSEHGIQILNSTHQVIGGNIEVAGNLVSGNIYGIVISTDVGYQGAQYTSDYNVVQGNLVGTKANGTEAMLNVDETEPYGNWKGGIGIYGPGKNNIIGGLDPGQRNIASGNYRWGIAIGGSSTDNKVQGNYVGLDITGTIAVPNGNDSGYGLLISGSSNNLVGGTEPGARNLISGNKGTGIGLNRYFTGDGSPLDNIIIGNYIGTDIEGSVAIPNTLYGMIIHAGACNNIIGGSTISERNIISGNGTDGQGHGILIENAETSGNRILGNYIGVDKSGEKALPNTGDGIQIRDGASNSVIGEPGSGRNIISGNGVTGISVFGGAHSNKFKGNYIGLDAEGIRNIGHPNGTGIYIGNGSYSNIIGGSSVGEGNFISGNTGWAGVAIEANGAENNIVRGNYIGTNINGEEGYGNLVGVRIFDGASNNIIGGYNANDGNTIAYNEEEGVNIYNNDNNTDPTTGNLILSNSIFSNASMGIDLGGDGMTENDEGDTDASPNNLQNYPVLDSLSFKPGYVTVGGYLNSTPNTWFTIQFFASKIGDDTYYGEGQTYLGSDSIETDSNGDASFVPTFSIKGTAGQVITATATDPEGNTSEFSRIIGGIKDHTLADINRPFYYRINEDGLPTVFNGSDFDAIENAFESWNNVASADIEFIDAGTTEAQNASATDGINLVTFRDENFLFSPGVLAVAAKTLKIRPEGDVAEILDADIVFNPDYVNGQDWYFDIAESENDTNFFDVQSVATHEIGHLLGMIHTGAPLSTMFFMISPGTIIQTLEKDDIAWASYRYPDASYYDSHATISGNITYGDIGDVTDPYNPGTHPPVAGALVLAINSITKEMIHAYTDAFGNYTVPVPVEDGATESYWIYIQPLDGDVFGFPLRPGNISSYIYSNTIYTDYPNEWYNGADEAATDIDDNVDEAELIYVSANDSIIDINLITNKDNKSPYVVDVIPSATNYNDTVNITSDIIIRFSEPVEINTFTDESCFITWIDGSYGGDYWYFYEDSLHIVGFSPEKPLKYDTEYSVHLTDDITDLKDNRFELDPNEESEIITTFNTREADETLPVIEDIIPEDETDNIFVSSAIKVTFSEPMDHNITSEGLILSCAGISQVEGDYTWSSDNTRLTFTPLRYLLEGTEYTLLLTTSLVDISENAIEQDIVITFTTVPEANPEVLYIGPEDLAEGVTVETPVVVDFSEPVNVTTITPSTFRLMRGDGSQVSGNFEFLMENSRVVFRPYDDLDFGASYTIELTTDIYDVSATALPLAGSVSTTFTCAYELLAPFILYLDAPTGVVGSTVMLKGSGFDPTPLNNTVYFDDTEAPIISSTLSTIAVEVPIGTLPAPVPVTAVVDNMVSNAMTYNVLSQTNDPCEDITGFINTGARSRDVAVDPEAGLAYVTNSESGTVSVIGLNLPTPAEIATIDVGDFPICIDIDAMGTYAYVTNFYSHTVSVIDIMDDTYPVHDIVVGENPYGVVVSPEGKVYVSNWSSENVSVIDVDPLSGGFDHVIANIHTGTQNRDIDISPEAGYVLVTGENGLTIINVNPEDVDYNTVIANVNTGTRTRDVEVTPERGLAIVTTEDGNLFIVDIYPGSDLFGSVIANITTGAKSRDIEISPEALFIYITNADGSVSVYKIDAGVPGTANTSYFREVSLTLHATITAEEIGANELEGLTIDKSGDFLYVVNPDYMDGKGQLVEVTLCCGPVSPQKGIANMIINVQNLLNSGYINEGQANALLTKLYNAQKKLDKGQTKVAINILGAFINQLNAMKNSGSIPESRADAMIYATNAIIYQLEHPPLKGLTLDEDKLVNNGEGFLEMLYPNPFSEELNIHFNTLSDSGEDIFVDIRIYNFNGQLVKILSSMYMPEGNYLLKWDGKYDNGDKGTESIYLIDFRAGKTRDIRTIIYQE